MFSDEMAALHFVMLTELFTEMTLHLEHCLLTLSSNNCSGSMKGVKCITRSFINTSHLGCRILKIVDPFEIRKNLYPSMSLKNIGAGR